MSLSPLLVTNLTQNKENNAYFKIGDSKAEFFFGRPVAGQ